MAELRIGVVGVGHRAAMVTYAQQPGVAEIVSCADPDDSARSRAREMFGPAVAIHADYRQMLGDELDAVFILTPDYLHAGPARDFLTAGVAVFVDKPLTITIEDCDAVLATAAQARTRLYVGHNLRHLEALRVMRELVQQGTIGRVRSVWCRHFVGHGGDFYFKDWHAERANTTGLLLQKGVHDIDIIHWLAGGYSRSVVALGTLAVYGANPHRRAANSNRGQLMPDWFEPGTWPPSALRDLNPVIDVEDLSMMLTRLDNGVLASYQQCHFTPDYWRNYTVIGDEGRIENFGDGIKGDQATIQVWNRRRSEYRRDADLSIAVSGREADEHGGADKPLVDEFLRFVARGGATQTSPVAAREAVAAGVAATTSLRDGGRPVEVPTPDRLIADYFENHQPGAREPVQRSPQR